MGRRSKLLLAIVVAVVGLGVYIGLLSAPASSQARTVYVDTDSIGGPCSDSLPARSVSVSKPWCTPARAIAEAPEGSTVVLRAGTYTNIRALNVERTEVLTLKPAQNEVVRLTGSGTKDLRARAVYVKGSRNLRFERFRINGGVFVRDSSFVDFVGNDLTAISMRLKNVSDAVVASNTFHDYVGKMRAFETTASLGEPGVRRLTIRDNVLHAIQYDAIALYWRLQDVVVEDNLIYDIRRPARSKLHTDAIQIGPQAAGTAGAIIVRRNRILDYDDGIMIKDGITAGLVVENNVLGPPRVLAAHIYGAPGARITNNTFADGYLYLRRGTLDATVTNNVLRKFAVDDGASVATSAYNIVDRSQYNPGYSPGSKDIDGQASFLDETDGDFRLKAGSLGVDAGSSGWRAPATDIVTSPRPSGAAYDIGAYELQPGT